MNHNAKIEKNRQKESKIARKVGYLNVQVNRFFHKNKKASKVSCMAFDKIDYFLLKYKMS
jgi:hypothetical protein